jgi:hypothetical protein
MKSKIIFSIIILAGSIIVNAQSFLPGKTIISDSVMAKGASAVFATDINNDGYQDIISASRIDGQVVWFQNINGQGLYSHKKIILSGYVGLSSVFCSDIDGDGDMDIISSSFTNNTVFWIENTDGLGDFSTPNIISGNADEVESVFVADLDGDGDMDIISASKNDDKIAWYENTDGNGLFSDEKIVSSNADGASSVFASDLDGDGDMDIISASKNDDKIAWYENADGNGLFSDEKIVSINADGASSVFASDLDGDGDVDIISGSKNDDKVAWYENADGSGNFSNEIIISVNADMVLSVIAADIDNDGDQDVLYASTGNNRIIWVKNNGDGVFGEGNIITAYTNYPRSVFVADINGDGYKDVLSASSGDNKIAFYINSDGQGNFLEQQSLAFSIDGLRELYSDDLNGDGKADLIFSTYDDKRLAWCENIDGVGNFGNMRIISFESHSPGKLMIFDPDNDGDKDILFSTVGIDTSLFWYENIYGNGSFWERHTIISNITSGFDVADLDGDGDEDILLYNYSKASWIKNTDGQGSFDKEYIITSAIDVNNILSFDVDGDDDKDVILSSSFQDMTVWYENVNGTGYFDNMHFISYDYGALKMSSSDVDMDGDIDLVALSSNDSRLVWLENDNAGEPFMEYTINQYNYIKQLYVTDFNGDGLDDIFPVYIWCDSLVIYQNLGSGVFSEMQIVSDNEKPLYACPADINGDNKPDIISASLNYEISWYENACVTSVKNGQSAEFEVFPVPAKDFVSIKSKTGISQIEIFNKLGQKVDKRFNNSTIDISDLPSGFYLIRIVDLEGNEQIGKFVKK